MLVCSGDYGEECANCQCLVCMKNDDSICSNCSKCDGSKSYSKWKMNCKKYEECEYPEETINFILKDINK